MSQPPDQLEALLARVRGGDAAALGELVQQYEPRVRLAARMLLGPALRAHLDSIDITQSVHRTLLLGMRHEQFSFQTPQQLMALLLTIVRRKVARQWRRLQKQQSNEDPAVEEELSQLQARQPGPEEIAAWHEAVNRTLDGLSDLDRQLLELRLQGHRTVEAARLLGVDATVLRTRLVRLRQKLRDNNLLSDWL